MGGTTAKAGVIHDGEPLTTGSALLGGYEKALPIQIAMMDIFEVGTGGGSIARVEEGMLRVGPQSAGAAPGPACYGLGGTEPTVTDANLVLGRLGADRFLGGEMKLDVEAAKRALKSHVADPLGMDTTAAADGILRIATTAMSYAVKGVTTERGLDVGDFVLVAYGGAGPLHAVEVARELGMRRAVVPSAPGVFSAYGMLFSDLRYDFVRTWFTRLDDASFEQIEGVYRELEDEGRREHRRHLGQAGRDRGQARGRHALCRPRACRHRRSADGGLREQGPRRRSKGISTPSMNTVMAPARPSERAEIVSLRTAVTGVMRKPPQEKIAAGGAKPPRPPLPASARSITKARASSTLRPMRGRPCSPATRSPAPR